MADNVQDIGFGAGTPESSTQEASAPIGSQSASFGDTGFGGAEGSFDSQSDSSKSKVAQKASKVGGIARQKLFKQADQQLSRVNEQLRGITQRLEGVAQEEGPEQKLIEGAVSTLRTVSSKLEGRSSEELFHEASRQMKQHPLGFVLGCFAVGFVGGRLVKG